MKLPNQSHAIMKARDFPLLRRRVQPSCSVFEGLKCAGKFGLLIAGPCDPLGLPEDLPICIPAFASYVSSCEDCIEGAAKTAICAAVSGAEKIGIPVPGVLKSFCG